MFAEVVWANVIAGLEEGNQTSSSHLPLNGGHRFPMPAPPIDGRQSNASTRTETRRFDVMQKLKGLCES